MKTKIQRYTAIGILSMLFFQILIPAHAAAGVKDEVIYPLKEISKLECRFEDFDTLSSSCKETLPILKTKNYKKYATQNGGYNDFTRIYTVLWGSSYKYGWDVGNGGHQGTDIATAKGTPVYSIADGEVIETGSDVGWGKYVSIEHTIRGKKVVSNYAHLSKILVDKGDSVDVGDTIGKVGSTGNSTGNHLHFQIDLPNTFHPYYYDWNACPYSYYEITEQGVCFDELANNTIDPLTFLESNGAILDDIEIIQKTTSKNTNTSKKTDYDRSIFATTVYHGYGTKDDVKEVQKIYRDLGYYDGALTGRFDDVEGAIIDYQIDRGVLSSRTEDGAGWFGPKTRAQTQTDYTAYLAKTDDGGASGTTNVVKNTNTIEKVSRANLMTREEIEAMEIQNFIKKYEIQFTNTISRVEKDETLIAKMQVEDNRKRLYRGNTPGDVHFEYDRSKISVFPEKFYSFANGPRDIKITGVNTGHTTLKVMIGDVIIESFSISVGTTGAAPTVEAASIHIDTLSVLGEAKTAVLHMKDQYGNKLVKSPFDGRYELVTNDDILFCLKRGTIQNIEATYQRKCLDEEYTQSLSFGYKDTISGILIFDYKILDTARVDLEVKKIGTQKTLVRETLKTQTPKGLTTDYEYFKEVIDGLAGGITSGVRDGYFLQDRELSQFDATTWIKNILLETGDTQGIQELKREPKSKFVKLTRQDFLELTAKYLGEEELNYITKDYRDLENDQEILVATTMGQDYEWKDDFGDNYFQPDKKITRGEAVYLLMRTLIRQGNAYLVRK